MRRMVAPAAQIRLSSPILMPRHKQRDFNAVRGGSQRLPRARNAASATLFGRDAEVTGRGPCRARWRRSPSCRRTAPSLPMIASQPWRTAASTADPDRRIADHGLPHLVRRGQEQLEARHRDHARRHALARAGTCAPRSAIATSEPDANSETLAPARRPARSRRRRRRSGCSRRGRAAAAAGSAASAPARSGRSRASSASCQHSTVSTASHGRNTSRFGIARSAARCSTG